MSSSANLLQQWKSLVSHRYDSDASSALGRIAVTIFIFLLITASLPLFITAASRASDAVSAAELLQQTRDSREVFAKNFPGFRSKVVVHLDGSVYQGTSSFRPPDELEIEIADGELPEAVRSTALSMLTHRVRSSSDTSTTVAYGEPDDHVLGRKIVLADSYRSVYRIRDRRILQVDRGLSDFRQVITVLETETTDSGRYLPRHVFVAVFENATGVVQEAWTYTNRFQKVDGEYLPLSRHVVRSEGGETSVLRIEWSDMEILEPKAEAADRQTAVHTKASASGSRPTGGD